ncbi:hypothetical protein [Neolewinella litorea]|uniref:Lipoprotein n=1 Tax=Neolewinella litorea TaxID=2562452 RepID=A0A4S4N997_9BACT|nr:hypothetical protein [Neolewinella litorea]THH34937.1 hypothetical protein E4021_17225 [Neolewinella litorea]
MKNVAVTLFLVVLLASCSSQRTRASSIECSWKGEPVIFSKEYTSPIQLPPGSELFTVQTADVEEAELLLREKRELINSENNHLSNNEEDKYKCYSRQYLGYVSITGEKFVIINLLNITADNKQRFEGWQKRFFVGFGDFYERNTIRYVANISDGVISFL